jgi:RNA polymerase sigma-70 factor (family 1)
MKSAEPILRLIKLISEDNSDAFEKFYDLYYPKIYRFSSYFVKSGELCEEIVSDIFFSIWQGRKRLPDIENIDAYIYTSTKNRAYYYLAQANQKTEITIDNLPIGFTVVDDNPEKIAITHELQQLINRAIADLPQRCRLIFLMAREEGLKYRDIAQVLSISEKTVNAQMVTALKKISSALKGQFYLLP